MTFAHRHKMGHINTKYFARHMQQCANLELCLGHIFQIFVTFAIMVLWENIEAY